MKKVFECNKCGHLVRILKHDQFVHDDPDIKECKLADTILNEDQVSQVVVPRADDIKDRDSAQSREALRHKVRMLYDLQRIRLQIGGRGLKRPAKIKIELHEIDKQILDHRAKDLHRSEKQALRDVEAHLRTIGFYRDVLCEKRGIGPTMAGVILSEFDIEHEDCVSKMWSFAGLKPIETKRCKKCHIPVDGDLKHPRELPKNVKCDLRGKKLIPSGTYASAKAAKPVKGEKLAYNSFLRSKLCGVLGAVLLKSVGRDDHGYYTTYSVANPSSDGSKEPEDGERFSVRLLGDDTRHIDGDLIGAPGWQKKISVKVPYDKIPYRKFYDDYKYRKTSAGWGMSDGHRHNASIRYMIKMMLLEIWKEWRAYEGLSVRDSYQEGVLGQKHQAA